MKPLNNYINEKLKLSDVNIHRPEWVDAKKFTLDDLEEGYIIETKEERYNRYIWANTKVANKLFKFPKPGKYIFVQGDRYFPSDSIYSYLDTDNYKAFPIHLDDDFTAVRVFTREKHYENVDELKKDIKNIDKF